jgi:hypothetical protein
VAVTTALPAPARIQLIRYCREPANPITRNARSHRLWRAWRGNNIPVDIWYFEKLTEFLQVPFSARAGGLFHSAHAISAQEMGVVSSSRFNRIGVEKKPFALLSIVTSSVPAVRFAPLFMPEGRWR